MTLIFHLNHGKLLNRRDNLEALGKTCALQALGSRALGF